MMDPFDYKEPMCPLSDGRKFYYPSSEDPKGDVPVRRIIDRLDKYFAVNDTVGAGEFLRRWEAEAKELGDMKGELSIQSELMGYYRKEGLEAEAMIAVERALYLVERLNISDSVTAATIYLNAATVHKRFGRPERALGLYERANRIYRENLDPNDERIAGLCNNSALALCDIGRFADAEELFVEAASITSLSGSIDEASTYVNMADMYAAWHGDSAPEVADCLDAAWDILDSKKAARDGYYAFVASKCAPTYAKFGMKERAATLEERSRKIYEGA